MNWFKNYYFILNFWNDDKKFFKLTFHFIWTQSYIFLQLEASAFKTDTSIYFYITVKLIVAKSFHGDFYLFKFYKIDTRS